MVQNCETPQTIYEAAAAWAVRMDRGPLSEADAEALETWLAADARRLGALMRARALFARTESAWSLEPVLNSNTFPALSKLNRRGILAWAAGGAVVTGLGAGIIGYGLAASKAYATARGEMRQVPLEDGSRLTLNTLSKVQIGTWFGTRDIRLETGEALLSLAGEQKLDYILRVGDWRLHAAAATFFVSHLPGRPTEIAVHRGTIDVVGPGNAGKMRLAQDYRLVLTPATGLDRRIEKLSPDQLARELAWLNGQLSFHDESLADAVQAFARYSEPPIIIRDPVLAGEAVSGMFAADDPAGFAQAIGTAFGVPVRIEPDRILIG